MVNTIRFTTHIFSILAACLFVLSAPVSAKSLADSHFELPTIEPEDRLTTATASPSDDKRTTTPAVVIVKSGDKVEKWAKRYKTSVAKLSELNPGMSIPLTLGDAILIPVPKGQKSPEPDLSLELRRGLRGRKQIALTIDCAWVTRQDLTHLLKVLKKRKVDATFFLTGIFFKRSPWGLEMIIKGGYHISNHTQTHPHCCKISDEELKTELETVETTIQTSAGLTSKPFWRAPFGERDKRVLEGAAHLGYRSISWTIDSADWMTSPSATVDSIYERVCVKPYTKAAPGSDPLDGAILLFHGGGKVSADALNKIIPFLQKKGYRFVGLETLITP